MKKIYFVVACFALSFNSFAQPNLTGAQINPVLGEQLFVTQGSYLSPGPSGANKTWDFSTITPGASSQVTMIASDANHPGANLAYDYGSGNIFYSNFDATEQAFKYQVSGGVVITFSNTQKFIPFPLNSSTDMNDAFVATFTSGVDFTRQGSTQCKYDGYGTVITPNGTYTDCIKMKHTSAYTDTYSGGTINYSTDSYYWFKAGIHYPIISMISFTANGNTNQYSQYYKGSSLSIDESSLAESHVYPNPTTANLTLEIPNTHEVTNVKIYNVNGGVVQEIELFIDNGSAIISVESLESGVYFLETILSNGSVSRQKFQKI